MSKVEPFYWNKLTSKSCSFESEQFFDSCFVLVVQGGCTDNIQYIRLLCCNTKGISRKVGINKVESFYWNKLSSKSCSFELKQFFDLCSVLVVQGGCTDNIQYI